MEDKYVIFKWLLKYRRWNCIRSEGHRIEGFWANPLSSCLLHSFKGTYLARADYCERPGRVRWDQRAQIVTLGPKLGPCLPLACTLVKEQ